MARQSSGRIATGLLIVLIGVLLLATTTDALPTESLWSWLPTLFVLLGIWAIWKSGGRNLTGPITVIAIAATFQLRNLGVVSDRQIGTWWPLFVVLFGALVLFGRSRRRRAHAGTAADEVSLVTLFGGNERRVTSDSFVGGEVVSIFGGSEIDLRDADVENPPAVIEAVSLFGGLEVRVPEDWSVAIDALTLFGASEDSRPRSASGEPTLVITGVTLFGGVEVLD
ncbi:MAG: LiaI-LiaF-like domain-containing protein [Halanaeroarchaeum sp.]